MSDDRDFTRPSAPRFRVFDRRGPAAAIPTVAETSWEDGIPAIAAEHRGSLADAEADAGYRWAAAAVADRDVLDLGSGAGHGSAILRAAGARSVLGVDADERSVQIATRLYGTECRFLRSEPEALALADGSFGAVVCLDLLERAADPHPLLDRLRRLLKPDGLLLVSLPTEAPRDPIDGAPLGPAIDAEAWTSEISSRFEATSGYRRRICLAASVLPLGTEAGTELPPGRLLGAEEAEDRSLLLLAGPDPLPELGPTMTLVGGRDLRAYRETIDAWEQRARRAEADGSAKHWELVASREAQRRLRKRLWDLEHTPLRKLVRVLRGRPAKLTEGPPLRPPETDQEDWL